MRKINGMRVDAEQFVFDGCHSFYLVDGDSDIKGLLPIGELPRLWARSCPDRVIMSADFKTTYASGTAVFSGFETDARLERVLAWMHENPGPNGPEFGGALVDAVEDFLDEKEVDIPNEERDGQDPLNRTQIWGEDYDELKHDLVRAAYGEWRRECSC